MIATILTNLKTGLKSFNHNCTIRLWKDLKFRHEAWKSRPGQNLGHLPCPRPEYDHQILFCQVHSIQPIEHSWNLANLKISASEVPKRWLGQNVTKTWGWRIRQVIWDGTRTKSWGQHSVPKLLVARGPFENLPVELDCWVSWESLSGNCNEL